MAEGAEEFGGLGGGLQEGDGFGFVEEGFEQLGDEAAVVGEVAQEPAVGAGDVGVAGAGEMGFGRFAGAGFLRADGRGFAGGGERHQAGEAAGDAVEAVVEGAGDEAAVGEAGEVGGEEGDEAGDDVREGARPLRRLRAGQLGEGGGRWVHGGISNVFVR